MPLAPPVPARDLRGDDYVDALIAWLEVAGQARYDEACSQLFHALQTAEQARAADAPTELVTGCLLHDVGHLILDESRRNPDLSARDLHHEVIGSRWLGHWFGPGVTDPVRLHVPAKRWLCTREDSYHASLSPASVRSLELQGGQMSNAELTAFEAEPHWRDAVALRRWEEAAKEVSWHGDGLDAYRRDLRTCLLEGARS